METKEEIRFTVWGEPFGKERPRFVVVDNSKFTENGKENAFVKTYTPAKTKRYEENVKLDYFEQVTSKRDKIHCFQEGDMVKMVIIAYFGIAKSTPKKKTSLMLDELLRPIKRPDIDNIFKVIADSLNGIAYKDDAQIVEGTVKKFYSDNPRVEIIISKVHTEKSVA